MSAFLWKYYLEDDVDGFLQVLEDARFSGRSQPQKGTLLGQNTSYDSSFGSPSSLTASSPAAARHGSFQEKNKSTNRSADFPGGSVPLSRADINRQDGKGLTILHHAASSTASNAKPFALALTAHPLIDLYIQDYESGWTALHRAFYFGNVTIARAIMERDAQLPIEQKTGASFSHMPSLIKVKDKEGHGPLDLYAASITVRPLRHRDNADSLESGSAPDEDDIVAVRSTHAAGNDSLETRALVQPTVDIHGDELFGFGSNRNFSLGIGDENERHFPERISFQRPKHLFRRFHREHVDGQVARYSRSNPAYADMLRTSLRESKDVSELPNVVRSRPVTIQDVQMAKFHSAVLTNDPISNLYACGHGLGGRLGTGNEKTQFKFICIEDFGPGHRKINALALGQDHTLAVSDTGELFSWGSNEFGQLGCGLPKENARPEELAQLSPKQVFSTLKKELVYGVAASRIHSVAHTRTSLFTWGKNEGQLGLIDAQAGTLKIQATPRQVAASRFSSSIDSISAIDRATICLLDNHEVHVFANYGAVKLQFPLEGFANYFLRSSFLTTKYDKTPNTIRKITAGGNTICALSSAGQIFTVTVNQRLDPGSSSSASTTNPNKIKAALSTPYCAWSLKKDNMAARDVAVDQDGSVILTTESGSVWRRIRRPKVAGATSKAKDQRAKEFKYSRVPNLTRALAVRASASGAWMVMRQDCDITKTEIAVDFPSVWKDLFSLLPIKSLLEGSDEELANPPASFWQRPNELTKLIARISQAKDLEAAATEFLSRIPANEYDARLSTSTSDLSIPLHSFVISGRSSLIRAALNAYRRSGVYSSELFSIETASNGIIDFKLLGIDFLTLIELVLYFYTDSFVGFWQHTRSSVAMAPRYRQVRVELMKIASRLDLKNLESAARRMVSRPEPSLSTDLELALRDPRFFDGCDAVIQLSDGEVPVHSKYIARRCPFFEGLFDGHAGGRWLAQRRDMVTPSDAVDVDLSHIESHVFKLVLRHIYADTCEELFDSVVTEDQEEFLDLVMDVLSVANELMLDRLSQACQAVLGRHVTTRNACQLLNAIAPSSVTEFKDSCLEYLCLSLEPMLCNHFLDELDEDLLGELDDTVRANQLNCLPFAKSGHAQTELLLKYPKLAESIDRNRRAKIDAIDLQTKLADANIPFSSSFEDQDSKKLSITPQQPKRHPRPSTGSSITSTPSLTPAIKAQGLTSSPEDQLKLPAALNVPEDQDTTGSPDNGKAPLHHDAARAGPLAKDAAHRRISSDRGGSGTISEDSAIDTNEPGSVSMPSVPQRAANNTSQPWGPTPVLAAKMNMQEIMKQTSSSRTSNLSLGLQAQAKSSERNLGSHQRMSQKERKRQQVPEVPKPASEGHPPPPAPSNVVSASPWKAVSPVTRPSIAEQAAKSKLPHRSTSSPQAPLNATPQLTMRQTVANTPASKQRDPSSTPPASMPPSTHRSVSTPQISKVGSSPGASNSQPSSDSKAIPIQSIRHQPRPQDASPSFYMHQSMADIISEEQAGKEAIKEAAAKRSLQEIQQEQEFQEWWDKESRAVQDAANAVSSQEARSSSSRRGRSRRRGRGKEKPQAGRTD